MSDVCSKTNYLRLLLGILLLSLAAVVIWAATRRVPFKPVSGRVPQGAAVIAQNRQNSEKIRIVTFNIHRCKGRDRKTNVDRVAKLLQGFDVVGLNEVHGNIIWDSTNQAEMLGERLNMAWLFAPTNRCLLKGDFGNGLLTRLPVRSWQTIPLPKNRGKTNRLAILVVLEYGERPLNLLIAHLGHRVDRKEDSALGNVYPRDDNSDNKQIFIDRAGHVQLDTVISLFLSLAEPVILMGDFNAYPTDPLIRRLKGAPGVIDAVAACDETNPPDRVDWIFLRGLKCVKSEIVQNNASDHPMVWAEVKPVEIPEEE